MDASRAMSADPARKSSPPASDTPLKGDNFVAAERPFPSARGVLSKAEIEALLRPDLPDDLGTKVPDNIAPLSKPVFDGSETQEEASAWADVARNLTSQLTLKVRADCHIDGRFSSGRQARKSFSDLALPRSAPACLFTNESGAIQAVLGIAAPVLKRLVAEACGGSGRTKGAAYDLSVLEAAIVREMLSPLAKAIAPKGALTLARIEQDPKALSALLPAGEGLEIDLDCQLSGAAGGGILFVADTCLPQPAKSDAGTADRAKVSIGVGALSVTLTARMASLSVPVSRLSNLKPGATLLLGVPADHAVELLSGGRRGTCVAEGKVGRKGQNMAVRISQTKPIG